MSLHRLVRFGLLVLLLIACGAAEAGERRVALVIGIGDYANAPRLANPVSDARAIAESLQGVGFDEVDLRLDLNHRALSLALQAFARATRLADVATVFYAGHGLELGGENYLVPVDAKLETDADVAFEAVPLSLVMSAVEGARRFRLVMLDACRDNPFAAQMRRTGGRGLGRGLAAIEPPGDTLVAYAARDGQVAADGDGEHSPFTTALLAELPTPGLEVQFLFRKVRDRVLTATGNAQDPHVYGSLGGEPIYLVPPAVAPPSEPSATVAPPPASAGEVELTFWRSIEHSREPAELQAYLRRYPEGAFAELARSRLARLAAMAAPALRQPVQGIATAPERPSPSPPAAALSVDCVRILQKAQLGEPLSPEERLRLRDDCRV